MNFKQWWREHGSRWRIADGDDCEEHARKVAALAWDAARTAEIPAGDERMYQWISWHQPTDDHRPLTSPPNPAILGWWCSGYTNDAATLCALVQAPDEATAQAAVLKDWPEAERWRFCEPRETTILSDRFKPTEWMVERGIR